MTSPPGIMVDTPSLHRQSVPFSPFGAENIEISFNKIDSCIEAYCDTLKKLSDKAMELGRVSALLWSIKMLRKQLQDAKCAFLLNAASLNPDIYHLHQDLVPYTRNRTYETLPDCLLELAGRFQNFRNRLDGFHEQTDEGVILRDHLNAFIKNVKYRAHCIGHYKGRLNTIPIQQYVHQIAHELAFGLSGLFPILDSFVSIGIPAIRYEQKRASEKYITMSTVATLFSGVTASTLQISVGADGETHSMRYVNILWICALVFSVGATLNSLLAMAWQQARTGSRAPALVSGWIAYSPGAFLGSAISSFSAGLILFAYSLKEDLFTAPLTIAATSVTFFGLVAAAFGLLYDRWITKRLYHMDEKDVGAPPDDVASIISNESLEKLEGDWFDEDRPQQLTPSQITPKTSNSARFKKLVKDIGVERLVLNKLHTRQISQRSRRSPSLTSPPAQSKFKVAANKVVAQASGRTRTAHYVSNISIPSRHGTVRFLVFAPESPHLAVTCVKEEKFSSLTWTAIYDVSGLGNPAIAADMWHEREPGSMQGKGLSWSPDGKEVLVRFDRELHIWDYRRYLLRKIRSRRTIKAVTWLDANTILTAEKSKIYKHSRSQRTMDEYELPHLSIRDIAVETTHNYLVILARVKASDEEGLPMEEQKQEKRIVVYDMDKKKAVYQLPVLEDIASIQIPRSGLRMLVSAYNTSFQAWEFDANIDSSDLNVIPILRRLNLVHPVEVPDEEYTSTATFGGINDVYIFSATTGGRIRGWRQKDQSLELQSSFLLSLGAASEDDEPQLIEHLAWRPSTQTFALTYYSPSGASTIQLWMVPGNTMLSPGAPPMIRTTSSWGSVISAREDVSDHHIGSLPPSPRTPISRARPASSPPIALSLQDIVIQAASGHANK